jgi:2-oxoisovalerate dehydrogenase E2 component (dihydrolipoyl transacylase)
MTLFTLRLPDIGEGIAQAELTAWLVSVGDHVREDAPLAEVMTDKATVEIPSPVTGRVVWLGGVVGENLAIGCDLVRLETDDERASAAPQAVAPASLSGTTQQSGRAPLSALPAGDEGPQRESQLKGYKAGRVLAAPSVRRRALDAGIELAAVAGTGPAGRILHADLDSLLVAMAPQSEGRPRKKTGVHEERVTGLRRRIAERMEQLVASTPQFTIVEEIDVTELEALRARLNADHGGQMRRLTVLPFLIRAIVKAVAEQPELNAHFDADAGILRKHAPVHCGVATQTSQGLLVPVLRHAEAMDLWNCAEQISRMAQAARDGKAPRDELTGSTITLSSLGALGALATTPLLNSPEVAVVGVNRITTRPLWDGTAFRPRQMMNISCSFDHRVIDGWDAAVFVQRIKGLCEMPALLFMEG